MNERSLTQRDGKPQSLELYSFISGTKDFHINTSVIGFRIRLNLHNWFAYETKIFQTPKQVLFQWERYCELKILTRSELAVTLQH